jgi:hypothetical protein
MKNDSRDANGLTVDQRILITMRKVLSSVIKEITPQPGMRHPLSDNTIEDVKQCFNLITVRERELANLSKESSTEKPRFSDEPKTTHDIHFQHKVAKPEVK